MPLKLAITPGEPAGIGPDLIITLAQQPWDALLVVFADGNMLKQRAAQLNLPLSLLPYDANTTTVQAPGQLYLVDIPVNETVVCGTLNTYAMEFSHYDPVPSSVQQQLIKEHRPNHTD